MAHSPHQPYLPHPPDKITIMKRVFFASFLFLSALIAFPLAQMRVVPLDELEGHVALGLTLRHLGNAGIFMMTTAHPDDENNGLLVMLNRGQGYRTALATATRGNGGQNEIGPEIFEALGVLRTGELAAMHRFDAADQYFTRAVDFGYSFSLEETFEKWGRDEITADYVRLIRMIRPDVIVTLPPTGNAGGQHHMASAIITRDAYKLAADPTKYPAQIKDGLRPWRPRKLYQTAGFGFPGEPPPSGRVTRVNSSVYDALLGKTYHEIGSEARSMHKCQGMGQLLALPTPSAQFSYQLVETTVAGQMQRDETALFDGVDTSILGLAKFVTGRPPKDLIDGLTVISNAAQIALRTFDTVNDEATLKPVLDGLFAVRALRRELRVMSIDEGARSEIDFRLRQKEGEFQQAALLAKRVKIEVLADDGVVVPGQPVKVDVIVAHRGTGEVAIKKVQFYGFDGDAACSMVAFTGGGFMFPGGGRGRGGAVAPPALPMASVRKGDVAHCEPTLTVPADARVNEPYWHRQGEAGRYTFDADAPFGLPMRPTPFYVQVTVGLPGGEEVIQGTSVQYRYEGDVFTGEKRTELLVVPALSVRVTPEIAIIPAASIRPARPAPRPTAAPRAGRGIGPGRTPPPPPPAPRPADGPPPAEREVRVTVVNDDPGPAESLVTLELPPGWTAAPAEQPVKFSRSDESQTVRFTVRPAPSTEVGEFQIRAVAAANSKTFDRGFQVIEYPHIRRYHVYDTAHTTLKVIDVRVPANLTIGYIMGVGDQVPEAIEQLGAKVEMLRADDLAWGNLSRFDAIVTGVRAYERRHDLRANNSRLLEYVFNGGTAIVQYNKFEFNDAQYGPYAAKVSSNRVTDSGAPVKILDTRDPVFTTPNEIGETAWQNWVQERGLYFLGEKDSRYRDLVQLEDPYSLNPGAKTGALVEARYGKGRWVYVGLNLWRQLPSGTDGAYQLLANLISLGRSGSR
jgi:LmbE family N-acetylglucosaminyl deacetylase